MSQKKKGVLHPKIIYTALLLIKRALRNNIKGILHIL